MAKTSTIILHEGEGCHYVHPTRNGQSIVGAVAHWHSEPWNLSAIKEVYWVCYPSIKRELIGRGRTECNIPISIWRKGKRRCIWRSATEPHVRIEPAWTILLHPWDVGPLGCYLKNEGISTKKKKKKAGRWKHYFFLTARASSRNLQLAPM